MLNPEPAPMRTLRFHRHGEWAAVLRLDDGPVPSPGPGQVRIRIHAYVLNPADMALCLGFMPGSLPRGIGLDVSGTVDAVGVGVANVRMGDQVFGVPDFMG